MAREAGIDAKQALISTWQNGVPDTSLASPYQFNHVIAYAPGVGPSGIWMDATEKGIPFGMLPWYDQGLPALIVDEPGKSVLTITPNPVPAENSTQIEWYAKLGRKGQAHITGKTIYRGANASELREELIITTRDQRRKWFQRYVGDLASGAELDTFFITGLDPLEDPLILHYGLYSEFFAMRHGNRMIIRPAEAFKMELPYYFNREERDHPVRFRFGLKREFSLDLEIPPNWQMDSGVRADTVSSDFGRAFWNWEKNHNHIMLRTGYLLEGKDIDPSHYTRFYRFLEKVRSQDLKEMVLRRKTQEFP
jgi:hypothetical protein